VTAAAAAAADEVGRDMSEQDGQACLAVAYAEARSVLKGGAVQVSEKCKAVANAALSQLAYYAGAKRSRQRQSSSARSFRAACRGWEYRKRDASRQLPRRGS